MIDHRHPERGTVSVIAALLFSTGVFFVMLAFAVDWGMINWEQSQAQRSADAATMALATKCAQKLPACATASAASAFARTVADGNAADGQMAIASICGKGETTQAWLAACTSPPVGATKYLRVSTRSQSAAGGYIKLPFSGVIDKTAGGDQAVISASAQASWAAAGTKPAISIFPAGAVGASTTLAYVKGNSNGNGYSMVTSPAVSGCFFTTLPAVNATLSMDNSSYNGSSASTCMDQAIAAGPPFVVVVATNNSRNKVLQWQLVDTLTKSGQNIVVKWGAVTAAGVSVVTMLP